jgi:hypothetical protein
MTEVEPMQIEGAYIAEVMKLMEYIESKEDPLIHIVIICQHHINSTLLHTLNNFKNLSKVEQSK